VKKGLLVILTVIFGLASFGVSIRYLYCCGNLAEITVSMHTPHEDCGMTMKDDSKCCETESVTLKVSPDQAPDIQQVYNFLPPLATAVIPELYYILSDHSSLKTHPSFFNLPPPVTPDKTVLHANFRI